MPAAVSSFFGSSNATAPSRTPITQAGQDDGPSFSDELDRAQNSTSTSDADSTDSSGATQSDSTSQADPSQSSNSSKSTKTDKSSGKSRTRSAEKTDSAAPKKPAVKESAQPDPEADADLADGGTGQQSDSPPGRKPQKKQVAAAAPDANAAAAANASLQAANASAQNAGTHPVHSEKTQDPAQSGKDSASDQTGDPSPQEATNPTEVPEGDATSDSASASEAHAARASKVRAANAAKADDDSANSTAPDSTATVQAIAASLGIDDSDPTSAGAPTAADPTAPVSKTSTKTDLDPSLSGLLQPQTPGHRLATTTIDSTNGTTQSPPEAQFADANRTKIVSGITGKLLPDGGSMQLTLDPANLGTLQVRVEMKNGVMSASFETSNDQASKLLTHSLGDLKSALEAQGVTVEKLHVSQAPKQQSSSNDSKQQGSSSDSKQNTASQQEQQRKDMMRRMWQKLMKGQDPLDLVA